MREARPVMFSTKSAPGVLMDAFIPVAKLVGSPCEGSRARQEAVPLSEDLSTTPIEVPPGVRAGAARKYGAAGVIAGEVRMGAAAMLWPSPAIWKEAVRWVSLATITEGPVVTPEGTVRVHRLLAATAPPTVVRVSVAVWVPLLEPDTEKEADPQPLVVTDPKAPKVASGSTRMTESEIAIATLILKV